MLFDEELQSLVARAFISSYRAIKRVKLWNSLDGSVFAGGGVGSFQPQVNVFFHFMIVSSLFRPLFSVFPLFSMQFGWYGGMLTFYIRLYSHLVLRSILR